MPTLCLPLPHNSMSQVRIRYWSSVDHMPSPGESQDVLPAEGAETGVHVGKSQPLHLAQGHIAPLS